MRLTRQPALTFPNVIAQCHIWGVRIQGAMTPNSHSAEIFLRCIHPQVSSSHVYSFGSYRVDRQTHPQTKTQTNRHRWKHPTMLRHILGGTHPGGYDSQILTLQRFFYNVPTSQVSPSYVYSFGSYRVDKQTHKQTPLKTSHYATTLGNDLVTQRR